MFEIYLHKNKTTGKCYIGYTGYSTGHRWKNHCAKARSGSNTYFHKAIRKYGEDDWETIILSEVQTENEAKVKEIQSVEKHKSNKRGVGYNMTSGGDGCSTKGHKLNPEHKAKAIAGLRKHKWTKEEYIERGKKTIGRRVGPEGCKNISIGAKKQRESGLTTAQLLALDKLHLYNKGKQRSLETREKQRLAALGKPKPREQAIRAGKLSGETRTGQKRGPYKKRSK